MKEKSLWGRGTQEKQVLVKWMKKAGIPFKSERWWEPAVGMADMGYKEVARNSQDGKDGDMQTLTEDQN